MKTRNACFGLIMTMLGIMIGMDLTVMSLPTLPLSGTGWLVAEVAGAAAFFTLHITTT